MEKTFEWKREMSLTPLALYLIASMIEIRSYK